jgi:hypothetical protein
LGHRLLALIMTQPDLAIFAMQVDSVQMGTSTIMGIKLLIIIM